MKIFKKLLTVGILGCLSVNMFQKIFVRRNCRVKVKVKVKVVTFVIFKNKIQIESTEIPEKFPK